MNIRASCASNECTRNLWQYDNTGLHFLVFALHVPWDGVQDNR